MRGCIAFFLFIFIVAPALLAFETAAAASQWLFNRDFYTNILAAPEVYNAILDGLLTEAGGAADQLRESGDYDRIAEALNSEEWRSAIASAVNQAFDVIEGRASTFNFRIPLSPLKALLESSVGEQFIRDYGANLTECFGGQEPFDVPGNITGLPLPICAPQNVSRQQFVDDLVGRLPSLAEDMPAFLTYTSDALSIETIQGFGATGMQNVLVASVAVLGVIAIGSWFFTGLIAFGSARGRLMWLGMTLVLPSACILLLGLGITAALASPGTLSLSIDGNDSVSRAVYDAVIAGIGRINTSFLVAGGIPVAIGLLLFLIGAVVPSRRRDDAMLDLRSNPTTQFVGKPKNDFDVFNKPKNDGKPNSDDPIQRF